MEAVVSFIKGRTEMPFLHRFQRLSLLLLCMFNPCITLQGDYNNGGYGYRPSYNGAGYAGAGMGSGGAYRGGRGGADGGQMNNQANPLWAAQGYPVTGPGGLVPPPSCLCAFCLSSALSFALCSFNLYSSSALGHTIQFSWSIALACHVPCL